jgi:hypothetical protein
MQLVSSVYDPPYSALSMRQKEKKGYIFLDAVGLRETDALFIHVNCFCENHNSGKIARDSSERRQTFAGSAVITITINTATYEQLWERLACTCVTFPALSHI